MSHFTSVECEFDADHIEEMIEALEKQFGKGNVEYHEKGSALKGYMGDDRSKLKETSADYAPPCEVVIRKENVGGSSNDVGYKLQANGKFRALVSEFDRRHHFNMDKQYQVQQDYQVAVSEKVLKTKGFTEIERIRMDDGSIKLIGNQPKVSVGTVKLKNW